MFFSNKRNIHLLIIGARGWGREVYWMTQGLPNIQVKGFLDDNPKLFSGLTGKYPPILSSVEDYIIKPKDVFFCALGDPIQREKYSNLIEERGGKFMSLISPKASIAPSVMIGDGSFIDEFVCLSDNVVIGKSCIIQRMSTLGHDVRLNNYVTIGADVFCGGAAHIGDYCTINAKSVISRNINVGDRSMIGAGSVVIKNVKEDSHLFGNPAHPIPFYDNQ